MKRVAVGPSLLLVLAGCASGAPSQPPQVMAADAWIRTTDGSKMPDMTALFVNLTNPSDADVRVMGAECKGGVAKKVEVHEMVKEKGQMVMRRADQGVVVPHGSHLHLAPGGPHIMLMGLTRALPAGSEEVECTLSFDNGQRIDVKAPVKQFTEEQDTYHTHAPSDEKTA